jgi:DNA-binding CsgD family transcriptional regulator
MSKGQIAYNKGTGKAYQWLVDHMGYNYDACLIWPFAKTRGYGQFSHDGKLQYAHRMMCHLVNGPAPQPDFHAAHNCGRGDQGCVHPRHLSWKSPAENQQDRKEHGTAGRLHFTAARINVEQRDEILEMAKTKSHDEIAEIYGITRRAISYIVKGQTWSDERRYARALTFDKVQQVRSYGYSKSARQIAAEMGITP